MERHITHFHYQIVRDDLTKSDENAKRACFKRSNYVIHIVRLDLLPNYEKLNDCFSKFGASFNMILWQTKDGKFQLLMTNKNTKKNYADFLR